jgi:hypothetical protein
MTSTPAITYLAASAPEWLYPGVGDPLPPGGAKVSLLTIGGIQVTGTWSNEGFLAWAPLLKRNKEKEARLAGAVSDE